MSEDDPLIFSARNPQIEAETLHWLEQLVDGRVGLLTGLCGLHRLSSRNPEHQYEVLSEFYNREIDYDIRTSYPEDFDSFDDFVDETLALARAVLTRGELVPGYDDREFIDAWLDGWRAGRQSISRNAVAPGQTGFGAGTTSAGAAAADDDRGEG